MIRDATPDDFDLILALNAESVHWLSPLMRPGLDALHRQAAYHRVVSVDGVVAGFLLALREGCRYDSPNYAWFAQHFDRFLYIDRVVVDARSHGQGLGNQLYADLFAFARSERIDRVTCEFDIEPPNEGSRRFHQRHGFEEVGTQRVAGGKKLVSLQAVRIATDRAPSG
jgi:uncharacterized protein